MNLHITQRVWEQIFHFLKTEKGLHTQDEKRLRRFMEGVWYITRSGSQWRLLPPAYGCWRQVHRHFKRWCEKGIWQRLLETGSTPDTQHHMIDATIVRAHACSAGYGKESQEKEGLGRSKGGFTTKIHALVDALGYPLKISLTAGQRHEMTQAEPLTDRLAETTVIADAGYDSQPFVEGLQKKGCMVVIPPRGKRKNPRDYDRHSYREPHLIECFFGKTKHFRRVFSRFDKTANAFLGFLQFVGALLCAQIKILFTEPSSAIHSKSAPKTRHRKRTHSRRST